jgi:hypothetical protein
LSIIGKFPGVDETTLKTAHSASLRQRNRFGVMLLPMIAALPPSSMPSTDLLGPFIQDTEVIRTTIHDNEPSKAPHQLVQIHPHRSFCRAYQSTGIQPATRNILTRNSKYQRKSASKFRLRASSDFWQQFPRGIHSANRVHFSIHKRESDTSQQKKTSP